MRADNYTDVLDILSKEKNFCIVSHYLPDGDSIGSTIALAMFLEKAGKKVTAFCRDPVPAKYMFLDKTGMVTDKCAGIPVECVLLVLDCSDNTRTGFSNDQLEQFKIIVNIDHHVTNEVFGDINLVIPEASATGEIIYELFCKGDYKIDSTIAEALYVAILTDTGSFKFENTTSRTHSITADLLSWNINPSLISQRVFDEKPLSYFLLLKNALSSLELWGNGRIASITLSTEMLLQEGATLEMLDGIVNYAKNIDSVEIGILFFIADDNEVKVGLRSKKVDVSRIANQFNGGGHVRAAGFRNNESYPEIKKKTIDAALKLLK